MQKCLRYFGIYIILKIFNLCERKVKLELIYSVKLKVFLMRLTASAKWTDP
jgi:hypothetical protein